MFGGIPAWGPQSWFLSLAGHPPTVWPFSASRLLQLWLLSFAAHVRDQRWVNKQVQLRAWAHRDAPRVYSFVPFTLSRSNNGLQGLYLRHRCRVGQVDATHRGQEVQVDGATHESLPLRPLLPGKGQSEPFQVDILTNGLINKCDNTLWFCHSCLAMSTGKGKSWKSTCFKPPYGSGRGHPYSTWVSPGAYLWSTSSTHRDRWLKKKLPSCTLQLMKVSFMFA